MFMFFYFDKVSTRNKIILNLIFNDIICKIIQVSLKNQNELIVYLYTWISFFYLQKSVSCRVHAKIFYFLSYDLMPTIWLTQNTNMNTQLKMNFSLMGSCENWTQDFWHPMREPYSQDQEAKMYNKIKTIELT